MTSSQANWTDLNQQYLVTALAEIRAALEQHTAGKGESTPSGNAKAVVGYSEEELARWRTRPALETLSTTFRLSPFERAILLLCAGMELDPSFAGLCAAAQDDLARSYPTFSLALAALPGPHWSALTPAAPL